MKTAALKLLGIAFSPVAATALEKTVLIAVVLCASAASARPIRPLNGVCNSIPLKQDANKTRVERLEELFRALEIPETRFHDVVAENSGMELVDVSRIFPLFHLDENDPRNYNFEPTDNYLKRAREFGGRLEFRFGEQIEHQQVQYQVRPPADPEKWARICLNIARHYNSGWGNGFHWNIDRFSVWEEPDNDELLTGATKGNFEKCYFKMYAALARLFKAEWPLAQVGGPNTMGPGDSFGKFIAHCAKEKLPLDFAAYTCYARDPQSFAQLVRKARKTLDDAGFTKTELEVSEWHIAPVTWNFADPRYRTSLIGPDSPAFTAGVLTLMQDEPVDHLFFYMATGGNYGLIAGTKPRPVYYVFRTFAELRHGERLEVPTNPAKGVYALAAKAKDGGLMLVSRQETKGGEVAVPLPKGMKAVEIRLIADENEPQPIGGWRIEGDRLVLKTAAGSAAYRVRLAAER